MLTALHQPFITSPKLPLLLLFKRNDKNQFKFIPTSAKKSNTGNEKSQTNNQSNLSLRISRSLVAKSATVIFGLGFVDAGYSGDWSRIGAISKETEELLKIAAYVVVPLCVLLASFISDEEESS